MPKRIKFNDISLRNIAEEIYAGRAVVIIDRGEDVAAVVQYPHDDETLTQGKHALERLHREHHGKSGEDTSGNKR